VQPVLVRSLRKRATRTASRRRPLPVHQRRSGAAAAERESLRVALTAAQIKAIFDLERMREGEREHDLLAVGLAAAAVWVATQFVSR